MLSILLCATMIGTSLSPAYASSFTSEALEEETVFSSENFEEEAGDADVFISSDEEALDIPDAGTEWDAEIVDLTIVREPDRVNYYYGLEEIDDVSSFDPIGLQFEVSYSDGTSQILEITDVYEDIEDSECNCYDWNVTNMDGSEITGDVGIGDYLLTVQPENYPEISASTVIHMVEPTDIPELTLGEKGIYTVDVEAEGDFICAKFIPEKSGRYVFYTEGEDDIYYPELVDSEYNRLPGSYAMLEGGKTYYFYDYWSDRNASVRFVAENIEIVSVELIKEPQSKVAYRYINTIFSSFDFGCFSLPGGKVKVTYSDGTTEELGTRFGRTKYGDRIRYEIKGGTVDNPEIGTYDVYVSFEGTEEKALIKNVQIKSMEEMPAIVGTGEKTVYSYGDSEAKVRFKTGKDSKYVIRTDFRAGEIYAHELYATGINPEEIYISPERVCTLKPNTSYVLFIYPFGELPDKVKFTVTLGSKNYDLAKAKISGPTTYAYTGKTIKPDFTIKYGKTTLKKDRDYVVYCDGKDIGISWVRISGIGKYYGYLEKVIEIRLKKPSVKVKKSGSSALKLTWSKITGAKGYIVERSTDGKKWSKVGTVKGKTYFTDKKVKKGSTYKYRVKSYCKVDGEYSYSSYSSVKTIKR